MELKTTLFKAMVHANFTINDVSLGAKGLKAFAYNFITKGEGFEKKIGEFLLEWLDSNAYILVNTSGSTGIPKRIKIQKQHMINSALATGAFFKLEENTTALLCLSADYIAGKMMLVRAMVLGWKIDTVAPSINPLDNKSKHYDFCAMVPLQLDNSIHRLHLLKKLIVGGSTVTKSLRDLVKDTETKIYETYGMTETISHIAARRVNSKKKHKNGGPFFKALPHIICSVDHRNCLVIKAPQLSNDIIVTNDVVSLKTYKKFSWKGRFDNVINTSGIKIHPEELEQKLHPFIVHRFFITSIKDEVLGDKLVMVIEDEFNNKETENLLSNIRNLSELHTYEIPKKVYYAPRFIETLNGKIQRQKTLDIAFCY